MGNQDGSETGALPKAVKKFLHCGADVKVQGAKATTALLPWRLDCGADVKVQGAKGLIQQQHLGIRCQGAGNGHPLLHSTGAFPRQQLMPIRQAHHVKEVGRALSNVPP